MTSTISEPAWAPDIPKPGVDAPTEHEHEPAPITRRTWRPADLSAVLDGTYQPPQPTIGARGDGVGMFYPGRAHVVAAESESGKTWAMLAIHAHEMLAGNATVYIDFEDDEGGVVGRLLAMGVNADIIRRHFAYLRPEEPLTAGGGRDDLAQALGDLTPTIVTLDGVTEGMTLHGYDPLNNKEVAAFGQMLAKPITLTGAAVVSLDHVTKDRENRGRYAIGAVHKLNGLNGAMYSLENREPFGVGTTGRSGLYISKDRPGQLRRHSLPSAGDRKWFADLVVTSHHESFVEVTIEAPASRPEKSSLRPTHVMAKIAAVLADKPAGLSKNAVETAVGGKREIARLALEFLVNEGYVHTERQGNAILHRLTKPFDDS
ncbi:AAA family ATPase [Streptosporangium roseum]|uniref:AAA family ATPase n=1 Tax=Streptosporangium roseum TaxID=2001 RepID=UPI0006897C59|nr:AAA family ATPase [Streptosporangium roseum]